jgi:hypothetical protein
VPDIEQVAALPRLRVRVLIGRLHLRAERRMLHGARQWHLIARADRDALGRGEAAAGDVDGGAAARLQRLRERDRLLDVPAALDLVGPGHAHRHRTVGREGGAHRVEDLKREANAVLQARTAILVVAPVGQRRLGAASLGTAFLIIHNPRCFSPLCAIDFVGRAPSSAAFSRRV